MRDNPAMDGIVIPPDAERVPRGTGTFRVLAELDELEIIDMLRILNVHAPNTGFARRFRER
jgi:hypothetical protein